MTRSIVSTHYIMWAAALLSAAPMVHAFSSVAIHTQKNQQSNAYYQTHHRYFSMSAVDEEQGVLSEQEEEILFGNEADEPNPPYPGQHRSKDKFGNVLPSDNSPNPLDHAKDPLVNKLHTMRETVTSCPQVWTELAKHCPDLPAILDEHLCDDKIDLTFSQMDQAVARSAAVFQSLGVTKGTHVAILGENSAQWLLSDHGIQRAGGVSAVRGADALADELRYIYEHSDSAGMVVLQGPKLLKKLAASAQAAGLPGLGLSNPSHGPVRTVILMHREKATAEDIARFGAEFNVQVAVLADLMDRFTPLQENQYAEISREDVATIVYTSGTTGRPKGVMLRHGNLLHQTGFRLNPSHPYEEADPVPGHTMLALLPVWHITERTFELWMITRGCRVVYSSVRYFKNDLAKHQPEWLVLVPRVLEKVASGVQDKFNGGSAAVKALSKFFTKVGQSTSKYEKIAKGLVVGSEKPGPLETLQAKTTLAGIGLVNAVGNKLVWSKVRDGFGGNVRAIICGGSALAGSLETFYETAGIKICVGYGLTECSPLLAYRRGDDNLVTAGCVGKPCYDTEVRVVDPDLVKVGGPTPPSLPIGEAGVVLGRGPQIMKGYYKNEEATAEAIDPQGWFNTGDLGRINPATGDLILTGRAKDTIVLSNGENIEPTPIEDAILGESALVDQVMLTGQDGRRLVAIAVLNPNELADAGFVKGANSKALQDAVEKVSDPKAIIEECSAELDLIQSANTELRQDSNLRSELLADITRATTSFQKWERVGDVYYTLEPFAMANGLLTQSYKVKRNVVMDRYANELPK